MTPPAFVTVGKNGTVYRRKFDHEEAQRRFRAGVSITAIAKDAGVSWQAVQRVVRPAVRKRMDASSRRHIEWQREPCRGGCGVLVWMHTRDRSGFCRSCYAEKFLRKVQHGTENEYTVWGCRCEPCREASSAARRKRRLRSLVPCSHGCGSLVDPYNPRYPGKPPECHPCAMARLHTQRLEAA